LVFNALKSYIWQLTFFHLSSYFYIFIKKHQKRMAVSLEKHVKGIFPSARQIPKEYALKSPINQREYLINGEMREWTGDVHEVLSPICIESKGEVKRVVVGSYPLCTEKEATEALNAAVAAYDNGLGEWPAMPINERIDCMEQFVKRMLEKKSEVVQLLMWEIGKSLTDSNKEFDRTVEYINDTIAAVKDFDRKAAHFAIENGIIGQVRRVPLGVVLCMGPFNYPLNETYTSFIPAMLMGNVILFKPPKHGTLLHYPMLEAFKDCFPKGVVNTVYGRGMAVIPSIMQSGRIDVLTLIGSSKIANDLKKMHPKVNRLRAILGLDAKNVAIVLESADVALAVKECLLGALSFNGQRCTAIKIIFVHRSKVDAFNKMLCDEIAKMKIGMPWEEGVQITPIPEPNKPAYFRDCIAEALANGASILNEGGGLMNESFVYPTVLYPVNDKMKVYREEQFGPLIPIVAFDDAKEPLRYIIDSTHGQQTSVFGTNSAELGKVIDVLVNQVSRININAQCQRGPDNFPFTGRKDSAEGTLSITDAIRSFSIRAMVATKATAANQALINEMIAKQESHFVSTRFIF
jgi:glyceraldehyde-3-phosphate dehydrogenase (NADP+)